MNFNDHDIRDEVVVSREENAIALEFVIPASSDFYDGHFPQYKLLPAVAQFDVFQESILEHSVMFLISKELNFLPQSNRAQKYTSI